MFTSVFVGRVAKWKRVEVNVSNMHGQDKRARLSSNLTLTGTLPRATVRDMSPSSGKRARIIVVHDRCGPLSHV